MTAPFYRIDKFVVPDAARQAFIDAVDDTDAVMRAQPGFVRHDLLEQVGGPGEFNFVTVAEWESDAVVPVVAAAIARRHAECRFDRIAFFAQHGIRADIATYRVL
ncbi:MAG: antibiotic biosynthesis monooxygenase family protein [Sphingomonas sp.]|uniref:antibiotic biosynthesis monooxygenase family protein n=1 Tax=Sphingomonas sp. TaxID=28214 RepID=UPI003F8207E7